MTPAEIERVFGRDRMRMTTGEHVEVFREEAREGEERRYTKRFLETASGDFRAWTEREWRILDRLGARGDAAVARVLRFFPADESGMARLETRDAGPTVDQWAALVPLRRTTPVLPHVFGDCASWWALARQCLLAFEPLHALGFVHLDFKADNVCLPWKPASAEPPVAGQPLTPDFERLALIDVAFSLLPEVELPAALPLAREPGFEYQSPRLLDALDDGRRGKIAAAQELDWRCDLFSLAALLWRYLPELDDAAGTGWSSQRHAAATAFVRRLLTIHGDALPVERPHRELIEEAALRLTEPPLAAALQGGSSFDPERAWPHGAEAMPLTRVIVTSPVHAADAAAGARREPSFVATPVAAAAPAPAAEAAPPAASAPPPARAPAPATPIRPAAPVAAAPPAAPLRPVPPLAATPPAAPLRPVPPVAAAPPAAPVRPVPPVTAAPPVSPLRPVPPVAAMPPAASVRPLRAAATSSAAPPSPDATRTATSPSRPTPLEPPASWPPRSPSTPLPILVAAGIGAVLVVVAAWWGLDGRAMFDRMAQRRAAAASASAPTVSPTAAAQPPREEATVPLTATTTPSATVPTGTPTGLPAPTTMPEPPPAPASAVTLAPAVSPGEIVASAGERSPAGSTVRTEARTEPAPAPASASASASAPPSEPASASSPASASLSGNAFDAAADEWIRARLPGLAVDADRQLSPVLRAAARATELRRRSDVRAAAQAAHARASKPAQPTSHAQDARTLNEAALVAYWRDNSVADAVRLQTRAFGANPLDPEVVGNLAFLRLKQQPPDAETARRLALHALTLKDERFPTGRIEDWTTLAIADALTGRDVDARNAWFVSMALAADLQRQCNAAVRAQATFGERLRPSVQAMLQRARSSAAYGGCEAAQPSARTARAKASGNRVKSKSTQRRRPPIP